MVKLFVSACVQVWFANSWHAALVTFVHESKGNVWLDPVDLVMFFRGGGMRPMRMVPRQQSCVTDHQGRRLNPEPEEGTVWRWPPETEEETP